VEEHDTSEQILPSEPATIQIILICLYNTSISHEFPSYYCSYFLHW